MMEATERLRILKAMQAARKPKGEYCCFIHENDNDFGHYTDISPGGENKKIRYPLADIEQLKSNFESFIKVHIVDVSAHNAKNFTE